MHNSVNYVQLNMNGVLSFFVIMMSIQLSVFVVDGYKVSCSTAVCCSSRQQCQYIQTSHFLFCQGTISNFLQAATVSTVARYTCIFCLMVVFHSFMFFFKCIAVLRRKNQLSHMTCARLVDFDCLFPHNSHAR